MIQTQKPKHYEIEAFPQWQEIWRKIPLPYTEAMEQIGANFQHDLYQIEENQQLVLKQLRQYFPEVYAFVCPEGTFSKYHWDYLLSAYKIRYEYKRHGISLEEWGM